METTEEKVLHQPLSLGECCNLIIANHISLPGIEDNYKTLIKDYPKIVARMALQRVKMTFFEYMTYVAAMFPDSLEYQGEKWFSMFDHYGGKKFTIDIFTEVEPDNRILFSPWIKMVYDPSSVLYSFHFLTKI
jgi:hypothetical protein